MIENIPADPEYSETLLTEKETTRMGVIHMAITAIAIIGAIGAVVAFALFTPTQIRMQLAQRIPSPTPTPKTDDAVVQATDTPMPQPKNDQPVAGTASPSPTGTATAAPTVTPSPTPIVQTINTPAGQDGNITDSGYVSAAGYVDVGRTPEYLYRGFVGFDLTAIPTTAKISKATLRLYQRTVTGTPYSSLGNIMVDHLDSGTTLTADSFAGGNVFEASFGTIGSSQIGEWKSLDVTKQVIKDRGLHTSSQFRLHFATETKGGTSPGDIASFSSSNNGSEAPQLVVEYN